MMATTGNSQQEILNQLMEQKAGMTLDELASAVDLSRTAVNQHLMALEREGYVRKAAPRKSGGRPQNVYVLTEDGTNSFPKQYSWFSKLLIQTLRQELGQERVSQYMYDLGVRLSADLIPRLIGKNRTERIDEIVKIMNETGFIARTTSPEGEDKLPRVECKNCVYHDLSKDHPEVCSFDVGFLSGLMGAEVEQQACVQRGGDSCRFRFVPPA
jgi:DeoR family suf operon transcriptional repressor